MMNPVDSPAMVEVNIDDVDDYVGSSLPTPEEYYSDIEQQRRAEGVWKFYRSRRRRFVLCIILPLFVLLFSLCIAIVGLLTLQRSRDKRGAIISDRVNNTDDHKAWPDSVDPLSRVNDLADWIVAQGWSPSDALLEDKQSPQFRAVVWLADFDNDALGLVDRFPQTPEQRKEQVPPVHLMERYALAVLYFSLNGRFWSRDVKFVTSADHCSWAVNNVWNDEEQPIRVGVDCTCEDFPDDDTCHYAETNPLSHTVKRLILPSMDLKGRLPKEIGLLGNLREIDFNTNEIHGTFPEEMGQLKLLQRVVFHNNGMQGALPLWLGNWRKLTHLNLAGNYFRGDLPESMSHMRKLVFLNLSANQLTANIRQFSRLRNIEGLFIGSNKFTGQLTPNLLVKWRKLNTLDASRNQIHGRLPWNLFYRNVTDLQVLDLSENLISKHLPVVPDPTENEVVHLRFLALHDNEINGTIHPSFGRLQQLSHLDLSSNKLHGNIPPALGRLARLKYLYLAFNNFSPGPIPSFVGEKLLNLVDISLQDTNRNGRIPESLGNLKELYMLDLGKNSLAGPIPERLGTLHKLIFLILYENQLVGGVPTTFRQLKNLHTLALDRNPLTDTAVHMCNPSPLSQLEVFTMQCSSARQGLYPYCPCCQCCNEQACEDEIYYGRMDPLWDTGFVRTQYRLHENDVVYYVEEDEEPVTVISNLIAP